MSVPETDVLPITPYPNGHFGSLETLSVAQAPGYNFTRKGRFSQNEHTGALHSNKSHETPMKSLDTLGFTCGKLLHSNLV